MSAPPQATMDENPGESAENYQSLLMGSIYNVLCFPCAVLGTAPHMWTIEQGYVGVVSRFGRFHHLLPPGRHRFNVMAETVTPVSLKINCLDVPPQEVMTQDNLSIKIDAVCYFRVMDAQKAIYNVQNYQYALANLTQVTMRTVLGENTLAEIFGQRQKINDRLKQLVDEASDPWGVLVSDVEIAGIQIDQSMQRAMAAKAESNQMAEAKKIQAKAQRDSASVLAEAASQMQDTPQALKLQYMETLRILSTQGKSGNHTIIIPANMDPGTAMAAKAAR